MDNNGARRAEKMVRMQTAEGTGAAMLERS